VNSGSFRMRAARKLVGSAVALLASACAHTALKVPPGVAHVPPIAVSGRGGLHEGEWKLGAATISGVERSANRITGRGVTTWQRDPNQTGLTFTLKDQNRTLAAVCNEGVEETYFGVGRPNVHFECSCREGDAERAHFKLVNGDGTAELPEVARFQVSRLSISSQNRNEKRALGYWFHGDSGQGAVDVLDDGRVWLPERLPGEARPALLCSYAALLLYRPTHEH
jgi:hypothetical protein